MLHACPLEAHGRSFREHLLRVRNPLIHVARLVRASNPGRKSEQQDEKNKNYRLHQPHSELNGPLHCFSPRIAPVLSSCKTAAEFLLANSASRGSEAVENGRSSVADQNATSSFSSIPPHGSRCLLSATRRPSIRGRRI